MISRWKAVAAALALLGAALGCSISTLPFGSAPIGTSDPGGASGLIAYVGSDSNIYTIDSQGKQQSPVTKDAQINPANGQARRVYQYPTWSPDGQRLAFMRFTSDAKTGTQSTLMAASTDGKQQIEAFNSLNIAPFYLFWSPDSQRLTFLANDDIDGLALTMAAAAGGESKVISTGQPYYWDWSSNNHTLIIHTGGDVGHNPDARLTLAEVDGSVVKSELDIRPGKFQAPAWSPTGDSVALTTQDNAGAQTLVLAGSDGKFQQTLAQLDGQVGFAWSPQGRRLAYTTQVQGPNGLTSSLVVLDTAHPDQTKKIGSGDLVAFFWSPDGTKIAYFVIADSGSQASVRPVAQNAPTLDLDVYGFDLVSGQRRKLATFAPTDSFNQVLLYYDQYQRSGTIWSPDSRSLVFSGVEAGGVDAIFVVDTAGGPPRKIAAGEVAFWSWK